MKIEWAAGSGLGCCDFGSSLRNLALLSAELGLRIAEFKGFEKKDFPGETFRIIKEKEGKQFGEYRTRHLVLEAWDRLEDK